MIAIDDSVITVVNVVFITRELFMQPVEGVLSSPKFLSAGKAGEISSLKKRKDDILFFFLTL